MIEPVDVYRSRNPFRSANIRPGANAFVFSGESSVDQVFQKLMRQRHCQIVGPHGSGKSTLMVAVIDFVKRQRWNVHQLTLDARGTAIRGNIQRLLTAAHRATPTVDLVTVDGFEELSRWQRSALLRKCKLLDKHLLVTSHRDMGLADVFRTNVDLNVASRVVAAICDREHVPAKPNSAQLAELLGRYDGNLRETLFALYDEYQSETV